MTYIKTTQRAQIALLRSDYIMFDFSSEDLISGGTRNVENSKPKNHHGNCLQMVFLHSLIKNFLYIFLI